VSGSIIQTALTNKALSLELDYRQPPTSRQGDAIREGMRACTELSPSDGDLRMWDELTYWFRII
jgi:hypothetical protein